MANELLIHNQNSYRKQVRDLLDPDADEGYGRYVNFGIMGLIIVNVAAVMLETVESLRAVYTLEFRIIEIFSVTIFTIEYLARLWSHVEENDSSHPIFERIKIASRPMMIIDLLAIIPFYLSLVGVGLDLRFLRALRLIRLLRLLKLVRYSETMRAFGNVFRSQKDQLIIALSANLILLVIVSSIMFFVEHSAQPETFSSIPKTMWWGVITLTTVGYGDVAPITPLGRFFGALVAILGIGLFALPASIMASGFVSESSYETSYCPDCGHQIDWERDLGHGKAEYELGERIRIDITDRTQNLDYRFHGEHGKIVSIDEKANEYEIDLENSDSTIEVDWRDLRSPVTR